MLFEKCKGETAALSGSIFFSFIVTSSNPKQAGKIK